MPQVEIYIAEHIDIPEMLEEAEKFLEYHPAKMNYDPETVTKQLAQLVEHGVILIAKEGEESVGWLGGLVTPMPFSANMSVLTELFWWVKEDKRGGTAGMRLLKAFEKLAKDHGIDKVMMTSTSQTPELRKIYNKMGYVEMEQSFCKEL